MNIWVLCLAANTIISYNQYVLINVGTMSIASYIVTFLTTTTGCGW